MNFSSPEEMQKYVTEECNDLYNPDTETYVFLYSDEGAIAVSKVYPTEAVRFEFELLNSDENTWSSLIGGGVIYENSEVTEFFKEHYKESGWMDTKDVMQFLEKPDFPFTREQLEAELKDKKEQEKQAPERAEKHMNRGGIER